MSNLQHIKEQEMSEFESLYGNKVLDSVFMFQKNWLETSYLRLEQAIREEEKNNIKEVIDKMAEQAIKYPPISTMTYKESPMYNKGYLDALAELKTSKFLLTLK